MFSTFVPAIFSTAASRILAAEGLVSDISGNISARLNGHIIISASGTNLAHLTGHDLVQVKPGGEYAGAARPSVETKLHQLIYEKRADVRAVVHTHSTFATVLAFTGQTIMGVNPESTEFSKVRTCPHKPYGTAKLASETLKYLGDQPAVLLEKHGVICVGSSIKEAVDRAITLEQTAKMTYFIKLLPK